MSDNIPSEGRHLLNTQQGTNASHIANMGHLVIRAMAVQSQIPEEPQKVGSIRISQPHHHHRFSIGSELDKKTFKFTFNSYSGQEPKRNTVFLTTLSSPGSLSVEYTPQKEEPIKTEAPIFDWETICLLIPGFLEACAAIPGIFPGP